MIMKQGGKRRNNIMTKEEAIKKCWHSIIKNIKLESPFPAGVDSELKFFEAGAKRMLEQVGKCETCMHSKGNTCDPMSFVCRNCDKCNWQPKE